MFSGIQPTGNVHLGNYLGAIKNWVQLQQTHQCIYCVVDMHAITVAQNPRELKNASLELAASLIGAGIDPDNHILMIQSSNPDHANLAWVFNCVARLGWLNRMTQFKDKAGDDKENASTGLFVYPNLMSADILAYHATHVPVGDDQRQHLELARDIAMRFNREFECEDFFPLIEAQFMPVAARVMSLRDGTKKMSKSDESDQSRINLIDSPDEIAQKIKRCKTDAEFICDTPAGAENRPELRNLMGIYAAITDKSLEQCYNEWAGKGYGAFKPALADALVAHLSPISARINMLMRDKGELENILKKGSEKSRAISAPIVKRVYELVGFLHYYG